MGLKEKLMKLIGIKKEDVKVTYNVVPTNLQVCIDNEELLVRLGQWMDIYPDSVKHTEGCVTVYEDYEPRNFLRRHKITSSPIWIRLWLIQKNMVRISFWMASI